MLQSYLLTPALNKSGACFFSHVTATAVVCSGAVICALRYAPCKHTCVPALCHLALTSLRSRTSVAVNICTVPLWAVPPCRCYQLADDLVAKVPEPFHSTFDIYARTADCGSCCTLKCHAVITVHFNSPNGK